MTGGRGLALVTRYLGGLISAIVVVVFVLLGALEPLEHWSLTRFFDVRGARLPVAPVVIVSLDESDIVELNQQWPFPRAMHGRLLRTLAAAKPLAIAMDFIFDTPSSRGPEDDAALGEAIAQAGNVVLAAAPQIHVGPGFTRVDPNLPLPILRRGAAGVGAINVIADADSQVRRAPLRVFGGDEPLPSIDAVLLRIAALNWVQTRIVPRAWRRRYRSLLLLLRAESRHADCACKERTSLHTHLESFEIVPNCSIRFW